MNWIRCKVEAIMKDHIKAGFPRWNHEKQLERAYAIGIEAERKRIDQLHPELDLYAKGQGN